MDINTLFAKFFEVRDQIHYWHLVTKSYEEHKILNEFYEDWLEKADQFIETYQGRYPYVLGNIQIKLSAYGEPTDSQKYLKGLLLFLQTDARKILYSGMDTDLSAIFDEMQILTSHTIYLLNLK